MTLPPGPYRRVMVMGPCGSGKSTLARRIGALLDLPVTHMDQLRHGPGWVERPQAVFEADLLAAAAQPGWVIDGNYFGLSTDRLTRADLIVMLDLPRRVTFPRIVKRIITGYGRVRPDSAPGCSERLDPEFLWFSWRWQANKRPRWLKTVAPYRAKAVRATNDADVEWLVTAAYSVTVGSMSYLLALLALTAASNGERVGVTSQCAAKPANWKSSPSDMLENIVRLEQDGATSWNGRAVDQKTLVDFLKRAASLNPKPVIALQYERNVACRDIERMRAQISRLYGCDQYYCRDRGPVEKRPQPSS